MRTLLLTLWLFSSVAVLATPERDNLIIKELNALDTELTSTKQLLKKAVVAKGKLSVSLEDMREWGLGQQRLVTYYQEGLAAAEAKVQETKQEVVTLRGEKQTIKDKYDKLRGRVCLVIASLITCLYLSQFASIVNKIAAGLGPWGWLIPVAGPVAIFALAYGLVFSLI